MNEPASQTTSIGNGNPDWLAWTYLGLAVAGAILPWMANLDFIRAYGGALDLGLFVSLANANPASSSLSRDLLIGGTPRLCSSVKPRSGLSSRISNKI